MGSITTDTRLQATGWARERRAGGRSNRDPTPARSGYITAARMRIAGSTRRAAFRADRSATSGVYATEASTESPAAPCPPSSLTRWNRVRRHCGLAGAARGLEHSEQALRPGQARSLWCSRTARVVPNVRKSELPVMGTSCAIVIGQNMYAVVAIRESLQTTNLAPSIAFSKLVDSHTSASASRNRRGRGAEGDMHYAHAVFHTF